MIELFTTLLLYLLKAQNLDEYNIIHIQGVMGSAAQKGRSGALTDTAAAEGWNIVNEQTASCFFRFRHIQHRK